MNVVSWKPPSLMWCSGGGGGGGPISEPDSSHVTAFGSNKELSCLRYFPVDSDSDWPLPALALS